MTSHNQGQGWYNVFIPKDLHKNIVACHPWIAPEYGCCMLLYLLEHFGFGQPGSVFDVLYGKKVNKEYSKIFNINFPQQGPPRQGTKQRPAQNGRYPWYHTVNRKPQQFTSLRSSILNRCLQFGLIYGLSTGWNYLKLCLPKSVFMNAL